MKLILLIIVIFSASVNLLMTRFVLFRIHQPTTLALWGVKVFVSAISPFLFLAGLILAGIGLGLNSLPAIAIGSFSAFLFFIHIMVIVAMHLLPQTDHAFDLILPKISPSAHNAIYDVERFLSLH